MAVGKVNVSGSGEVNNFLAFPPTSAIGNYRRTIDNKIYFSAYRVISRTNADKTELEIRSKATTHDGNEADFGKSPDGNIIYASTYTSSDRIMVKVSLLNVNTLDVISEKTTNIGSIGGNTGFTIRIDDNFIYLIYGAYSGQTYFVKMNLQGDVISSANTSTGSLSGTIGSTLPTDIPHYSGDYVYFYFGEAGVEYLDRIRFVRLKKDNWELTNFTNSLPVMRSTFSICKGSGLVIENEVAYIGYELGLLSFNLNTSSVIIHNGGNVNNYRQFSSIFPNRGSLYSYDFSEYSKLAFVSINKSNLTVSSRRNTYFGNLFNSLQGKDRRANPEMYLLASNNAFCTLLEKFKY